MGRVDFTMGEKKYVCISVKSTCRNRPFDVTSAKYILRNGDQEENTGDCIIEKKTDSETILSALIQPMIKGGSYTLEYTYEIPPEILKYEVKVKVS